MKFLLLCSVLGFAASQTTPDPSTSCGPAIGDCQYGTFEYGGECYPEPGKTCFSLPDWPCGICDANLSCTPTSYCALTYYGPLCFPNVLGGSCFTAETPAPGTPECGPCGAGDICPPASYCYSGTCYATYPDQGCPSM